MLILLFVLGGCSLISMISLHREVATIIRSDTHQELYNHITLFLQQAGIGEYNIIIRSYEDDIPNAFTISSIWEKKSLIAFSSKLLEIMPPASDAFQAVAAHEIVHIKNETHFQKAFIRISYDTVYLITVLIEKLITSFILIPLELVLGSI